MSNKHFTSPPSDIALARLETLLESVNSLYQAKGSVLESDIINAYHEALNTFFDSLDGSIIGSIMKIYAGAPADPLQYNTFTTAMQKDILAVYSEIGTLDKIVVSSFNSILSERQQALDISRRVSNKLGDYLLYADPTLGAGFFYGDSFNTADRFQIGSSLVEGDECFHSSDEGIILLPLDGDPDRPSIKTITINSASNGIAGSNYQIDVFGHDAIEVIGDNQPNTWFEYEKVTTKELSVPLVLDLTISLDQVSVINHININPINFGTPTPVNVIVLETSKDGKEYVSIKDEVPLKDFVSEDDKEEFDLSPASSKYSGQGFYSFLPRKVQYIHIRLHQSTPYVIDTLNGVRLRYAIGLRDINIVGRKFKEKGSIISSQFSSSIEVKKVSLWASESPIEASLLADLGHAISPDDGATWYSLQPQGRSTFEIPEVINFNNTDPSSITTSIPVTTMRHKVSMSRDKKAFDGNITLKQERITKLDVVNTPAGGSFDVSLSENPIKETVRVVMPFMGSFSCPRGNTALSIGQSPPMSLDFVEFVPDSTGTDTRSDGLITGTVRYPLPYRDIPNLTDKMRVFYNGSQLQYSAQDTTSLASLTDVSKVYFLNKGGSEIQFGYPQYDSTDTLNDKQRGFLPSGGKIQICLDGDNPILRLTDRGYVLTLSASSDGFKETMSLVALPELDSMEAYSFNIPRGAPQFIAPLSSKNKTAIRTYPLSLGKSNNPSGSTANNPSGNTANKPSSTEQETEDTENNTVEDTSIGKVYFGTGDNGSLPPIFDTSFPGGYNITEIKNGIPLTEETGKHFIYKVQTVAELTSERHYTFDPYTGVIVLGGPASNDRDTILVCNRTRVNMIPIDMWEYDRNLVSGRIDTRKIVLNPRFVYTTKQTVAIADPNEDKSFALITSNTKSHSWFNKNIVRGTVKLSGFFNNGIQSVEVPFVDGQSELTNKVSVRDELMTFVSSGSNLWSYTLKEIYSGRTLSTSESLSFLPVRSVTNASSLQSLFGIDKQKSSLSEVVTQGDWFVDTTGLVTISYLSMPMQHLVSYAFISNDIGVDLSGLYSIDYYNGVIHFSQIPLPGSISFEVSCYSAFYNIGKIVSDGDIEKINTEEKKITFGAAFGMQFLKQDQANRARPQVLKVLYEYYKKSTESLKDLEPYFSPICKDVAFRAVTSDLLEEL